MQKLELNVRDQFHDRGIQKIEWNKRNKLDDDRSSRFSLSIFRIIFPETRCHAKTNAYPTKDYDDNLPALPTYNY